MNKNIYPEITESVLRGIIINSILEQGNDYGDQNTTLHSIKKINKLDLSEFVKKINRIVQKYGLVGIDQRLDSIPEGKGIEEMNEDDFDYSVYKVITSFFGRRGILHNSVLMKNIWDAVKSTLKNNYDEK